MPCWGSDAVVVCGSFLATTAIEIALSTRICIPLSAIPPPTRYDRGRMGVRHEVASRIRKVAATLPLHLLDDPDIISMVRRITTSAYLGGNDEYLNVNR